MKVHNNLSSNHESVKEANACCGTNTETAKSHADPCCDQPSDGSSCCDKSATKEENSKTTGCC